jgi:hypothetical protein
MTIAEPTDEADGTTAGGMKKIGFFRRLSTNRSFRNVAAKLRQCFQGIAIGLKICTLRLCSSYGPQRSGTPFPVMCFLARFCECTHSPAPGSIGGCTCLYRFSAWIINFKSIKFVSQSYCSPPH